MNIGSTTALLMFKVLCEATKDTDILFNNIASKKRLLLSLVRITKRNIQLLEVVDAILSKSSKNTP